MFKFKNTVLEVVYNGEVLATIRRVYPGKENYKVDYNVENATKAIKEGLDEFALDGWLIIDLERVPETVTYKGPDAPSIIWDRTPDKDSEDKYLLKYDDIDIDPETREYDRLEFLARYYTENRKDKHGIWFRRVV